MNAAVGFGAIGLLTFFAFDIVVMGVLGLFVLVPLVAVLVIAGVVTYFLTAAEAVSERDWLWLFHLIAAPGIAVGTLPVLLSRYLQGWWAYTSAFDGRPFYQDYPLPLWFLCWVLVLALAIGVFVSVFAAPVWSVMTLRSPSPVVRLAAYPCWLFTASFWGVMVVQWLQPSRLTM